ncbi:fungal hydrophobin [Guyanagaster necrorhizus]|uniref:Hydrophobin n=1 Tax=Guyanagaster necrorhizus TaxID=856835 RepID=A0A9P7VL44_9AGAR|nr:fungal hydrophobin [Guyanagaster necrorhizus MCA 3950]KAG7442568.1 fungal hydrophobin [Guyanagaster necrorhizus MCA 3950]
MFSRIVALAVLALPLFVVAAPATNTTVTGGSCNTGSAQCCKSVQDPSSSVVQEALGLLDIPIGDVTAGVGLTCDPITIIGLGTTQCANQPVCCKDNNYNGVVALGCTPINVGL